MYGVTKVAGELLCDYYYVKYGVDTRGVRFPGLISYATLPEAVRQTTQSIFIIQQSKKESTLVSLIKVHQWI